MPSPARAEVLKRLYRREEQWLQRTREVASDLGWLTYHTRDSRKSDPGFPDLVLVRGERIVMAELKLDGKKPTAVQQAWLDALARAASIEVYVWRPSDEDEVLAVLS